MTYCPGDNDFVRNCALAARMAYSVPPAYSTVVKPHAPVTLNNESEYKANTLSDYRANG